MAKLLPRGMTVNHALVLVEQVVEPPPVATPLLAPASADHPIADVRPLLLPRVPDLLPPPSPDALPISTPAIRAAQAANNGWSHIERIDRSRLARGLKFRMRVVVSVCDSERRSYVNWPDATATIEVPGVQGGKDLVWAVDELIEALARVGPVTCAQVLRMLMPERLMPERGQQSQQQRVG